MEELGGKWRLRANGHENGGVGREMELEGNLTAYLRGKWSWSVSRQRESGVEGKFGLENKQQG